MYRVDDMRNMLRHRLFYYDTLNEAENFAVLTMNSIKDKLPSGAWERGEWGSDILEYTERGASGAARVYIRVFREPQEPMKCHCGERANLSTSEGYYCDKHVIG